MEDPPEHRTLVERANVRLGKRAIAETFLHLDPTSYVDPVAHRPQVHRSDRATMADLLALSDDDAFVDAAYRAVLRRAPDPSGRKTYRDVLRAGTCSRLDVIHILRDSPEGRSLGDSGDERRPIDTDGTASGETAVPIHADR